MKLNTLTAMALLVALLSACGTEEVPPHARNCLESVPESISGLEVSGARSEQNVIANLWPVVCRAREFYRESLKANPDLKKGTVELKLAVEFNGEIVSFDIVRNTVEDAAFEQKLRNLLAFMDFDPYGAHNSESDIVLPMHFKP